MIKRAAYAAVAVLLLAAAWASAAPVATPVSRFTAGAEDYVPARRLPGPAQYVEGEILVSIKPEFVIAGSVSRDASQNFDAVNASIGATVVESLTMSSGEEVFRLKLPAAIGVEQAVATYRANRFVQYAEPNYLWFAETTPGDPWFNFQWGYRNVGQPAHPAGAFLELGLPGADIHAAEAWDVRTDASSVLVAVIDSGICVGHPDLTANIWVNPHEIAGNGIDDDENGFVDDINGWDFANDDASVYDSVSDDSHGTHVAGTIGAVGNNGIAGTGVAWTARIMSAKFISGESGDTMDAIKAIKYVAEMGAKIVNCSWGGAGYSELLEAAMRNSGLLFIVSAGNEGLDNDLSPHYPSSYDLPNVIAVAASDWNDNLANFSCYGAESVDIAAPGHLILSTIPPNAGSWYAGTSMATPHVTGAAALVAAEHPTIPLYDGDGYTIKDIILKSADPNPAFTGKMTTGGRLNLANAIKLRFPLQVSVNASATFGAAPLEVTFTAQVDRPQDVLAATWYFDDHAIPDVALEASSAGARVEGFSAVHVYENEGAYLAWFVVESKDGSVTEWPVQVVVANPGTIIYVDDDGGYNWHESFLNTAEAAGLSTVVVNSRFPLGLSDGFDDRMLVWDTERSWLQTILPDQQEYLARFLGNGGRLLVLSPDYFADWGYLTPFAAEWLHVDGYYNDAAYAFAVSEWKGIEGDPITHGMAISDVESFGLEDWLAPGLNARVILVEDNEWEQVTPALRYADENYRVVFSTVPWLELPTEDEDPNNAVYFLKKIRDYLMGDINVPPTISAASATPRFAFVDEEITFTAAAHDVDTEGAISYEWEFTGGSNAEGATVTKAFPGPGVYLATLTVTDADDEYSQEELTVVVVAPDQVVSVYDEDEEGDADSQLAVALNALSQSFVGIGSDVVTNGGTTGLERFRIVWNCGELGGLDAEERAVLADYLDRGGALLLIGQEVMYSLGEAGAAGMQFAADWLHVTSVEHDVGSEYVIGAEHSLISGEGYIDLEFPEDFDDWTDSLTIDSAAKPVLFNDKDKVCALSYSGDGHRLVFMAVAFEALKPAEVGGAAYEGGDLDPIDPLDLLANALNWIDRPVVTVDSPEAGEIYSGTAPIGWEAVDPLDEILVISLEYSNDGGATWKPIAAGQANDGSYSWNLVGLPTSGACIVRVTASKEGGFSGFGDSEQFFVLAVGPNALSAGPNPARSAVNFYVNPTSPATLYVFDIAGRRVFTHEFDEGEIQFTWDLTNSAGAALPNGLYLCYVLTEDGARSDIMRLVISR